MTNKENSYSILGFGLALMVLAFFFLLFNSLDA